MVQTGIAPTATGSWRVGALPCEIDLRDAQSLEQALHTPAQPPDAVLHLAAQSSVAESFQHPYQTYESNFLGTLNLISALKVAKFTGRLVYVSSAEVYGNVPSDELPVAESRAVAPRSPYAVSKAAAELLCLQQARTDGMDVIVCRPFTHIGPGQDRRFSVSDFAAQLVEISQGLRRPVLNTGNIDLTRDFLDVRDVVRAYFSVLAAGESGCVYNVCSGQERSLRTLIGMMTDYLGISVEILVDPARLRNGEQTRMAGSNGRLKTHTDWSIEERMEDTLIRIVDYWKARNQS